MKKVVSFCVLSVFLAMFSLSTRAQGTCCITMTPSSLPTTIVLDSVYTFNLAPFLGCVDESTKISLEWELYRNGTIIPRDSLTSYINELRIQTKLVNGGNVTWVGDDYTSNYCDDGDGTGSYPGAYTPVNGVGDCARNGYFSIIGAGGQNNPDFFDFFYAKFFQDATNTAHRLRINFKEDGQYQIIINIRERIGGTTWDHFVANDERYKIGGHQSTLGRLLSTDTIIPVKYDTIDPITICVGTTFTYGSNPPVVYSTAGIYDAIFYSASGCSGAIDSVIHFQLIIDDPDRPLFDDAHSQTQICDDGMVTLTALPVSGTNCIWYDQNMNVIDTATFITPMITANATFYVISYNEISNCVSPDTLEIFVEHYNSPVPVLASDYNGVICAEHNMNIYLNDRYNSQSWRFETTPLATTDTVHHIVNATIADGGEYFVNVSDAHVHAVYGTALNCYGVDSIDIVVNALPEVVINPDAMEVCVEDTIQFTATSATATTYQWAGSPIASLSATNIANPQFTNTVAGTYNYNVRVSDVNGCTSHRDTITVTVNALPNVTITPKQTPVCIIRNTDTLQFAGAVTYDWKAAGVLQGTVTTEVEVAPIVTTQYTVIGTDANGCKGYDTTQIVVNDSVAVTFTLDTDYCQNANPVALPTVSNEGVYGTWNPATISTATVGTATYTFTPAPGECSHPKTIQVVTYELPVVMISKFNDNVFANPLLDTTITDFVCPNAGDQFVYDTINGGVAPYTVTWTGTSAQNDVLHQATVAIANTCNTNYTATVSVEDANHCVVKDIASITFTVNDETDPVIVPTAVNTVEAAPTMANNCEYLVPEVMSNTYFTATDNCNINTISQLPIAGTVIDAPMVVTVTVEDMCGNTATLDVNVTIPAHVVARDSLLSMELCPGDHSGKIRAWASLGLPPYTINLKDSLTKALEQSVTITNAGYTDFLGLTAKKYMVEVVDANGCADTTYINVSAPNALTYAGTDTTMVSCFNAGDGQIAFTVNGGTLPYNINVKKDGAVFSNETTGNTILLPYADTLKNLTNARYAILVTDDHGCQVGDTLVITQPDLLRITNLDVLNNVRCYGEANGNATVAVTGGNISPVIQYTWTNELNVTVSNDAVTGRILPIGTYTIVVEDVKGCQTDSTVTISQPTQLVINGDSIATPDALCTRLGTYDISISINGGTTPYHYAWAGDAAGLPDAAAVQVPESLPINCNRTYNVSVTVTDDSNCTVNKAASFVVADTEAPTIVGTPETIDFTNTICTPDQVDTCKTVADLLALNGMDSIFDNCPSPLYIEHNEVVEGTCPIVITRTYTVYDSCGNHSSVNHVIRIFDTEYPSFTAPHDTTLYKDAHCNADISILSTGDVLDEYDNCTTGLIAIHSDSIVNGCAGIDTIIRTWKLEDGCGNTTSHIQVIAVKDTTKPHFTAIPVDKVVECDGTGNLSDLNLWLTSVAAADNCATTVTITNNYDTTYGTAPGQRDTTLCGNRNTYSVTVTWRATDGCTNFAETTATFTVEDTRSPFIYNKPVPVTMECDIADFETRFNAWVDFANVVVDESCNPNYTLDTVVTYTPACGNTGVYKVVWIVDDGCSVPAKDSSTFTIVDTKRPTFGVAEGGVPAAEITVECDGAGNVQQLMNWLRIPRAVDACDADLIYSHNCDTINLHADGIHYAGYVSTGDCSGYYNVEWTATDDCGNVGKTTERFVIDDAVGPVFTTVPQNITVQCGAAADAALPIWLANYAATDGCTSVDTSYTNFNGNYTDHNPSNPSFHQLCGELGYYEITWTATDICNNSTMVTARFTVIDTVSPVVTGTLDTTSVYQTIDCDVTLPTSVNTVGQLLALGGITAVDGCNVDNNSPVVWFGDESVAGGTICEYYHKRTYEIRGNCYAQSHLATRVYQYFRVLDTIAPQVAGTLPELTVQLDNNCNYIYPDTITTIDGLGLTITDCHTIRIDTMIDTEYGLGCDRYVIRTYTIKDECNNETNIYQNIRLEDNVVPAVVGTLMNDTVQSNANCVIPDVTPFATVADVHANLGDLTITDCNMDDDDLVALVSADTTTNQCPIVVTRHYTASDSCGNVSVEFLHYIIVEDNIAPLVVGTLTNDTVQLLADCVKPIVTPFANVGDVNAHEGDLTFIDCNIEDATLVTLVSSDTTTNQCPIIVTRHYTVTDSCGNTSMEFLHNIIIEDNVAPAITGTLMNDTVQLLDNCIKPMVALFANVADVHANAGDLLITDCNIEDATIVTLKSADTSINQCPIVVTRHYTVTDSCGNISDEFTHTIIIEDNVAPAITGTLTNDTVQLTADCVKPVVTPFADVAAVHANTGDLFITDCNIEDATLVTLVSSDTTNNQCPIIVTRHYTVTDSCGNTSAEFIHNIVIEDNVAPAITGTLMNDTVQLPADCVKPMVAPFADVAAVHANMGDLLITDCNIEDATLVTLVSSDTTENQCPIIVTRHYTVTDSCGNTSVEFLHQIVIEDNIAPAITGTLMNDTLQLTADCVKPMVAPFADVAAVHANTGDLFITDCNIDDATLVTLVSSDTTDNQCPIVVTRHYTVTDSCGNTSVEFLHYIIIEDNIAPAITGTLTNDTLQLLADCVKPMVAPFADVAAVHANTGDLLITDCNIEDATIVNLVSSDTTDSQCPIIVTRHYTVTDSCGNTSLEFTHQIVLEDNLKPIITGTLTDLTVYMDDECSYTLPDTALTVAELLLVGGITDIQDCNLVSDITVNDVPVTILGCNRSYTRTYTITDSCGHDTTALQTIYVRDTNAPVVTGNLDTAVYYLDDACVMPTVPQFNTVAEAETYSGDLVIEDCNLDPMLNLESVDTSSTHCPMVITRHYYAQDLCGNEKTWFTHTIVIMDDRSPVVTGTLTTKDVYVDLACNFVYPDTARTIDDLVNVEGLTSVTDCNLDSNVLNNVADVLYEPSLCNKYIIRSYTITDSCGNNTAITQRFNLIDTIKPWFTAVIPDQPANSVGSCTFQVPDLETLVRTNSEDNCTVDLIVSQSVAANTTITAATAVTVTIKDSCNNERQYTLNITLPQPLTATVSTTDVRCFGGNTGIATIYPTGGTTPYSYMCFDIAHNVYSTDITVDTLSVGDYYYAVLDDDECMVALPFTINQPALLEATLTIDDAYSCENDSINVTAAVIGGYNPYIYSWEVLDAADNSTVIAGTANTIRRSEPDGSYRYVVTVVDDTNCVTTDTIASVVTPEYFFEDTARVCFNTPYVWVGHRTIAPSEFPVPDMVYDIYDSLVTVDNGCDSVWVLHLTVTDKPYFELRAGGEPNVLSELAVYDTVSTGNTTANYELFVRKNCTDCDTKVSIEYEIFRFDTNLNSYVLIPNHVSDYFTPNYVTYMDQYAISYQASVAGQVSVPVLYGNLGYGMGRALNYFNLCFLSPDYACNPTPTPSAIPFYSYGRANIIKVLQWRTAGDYKLIAKLQKRTGGTGWGGQGYCPADGTVGGHESTIAPMIYDTAEFYFHVIQGAGPVMPLIDIHALEEPTSNDETINEVAIYPNPARDYFTIELTGFEGQTNVLLSNSEGAVVERLDVNVDENTRIIRVNTRDYAQGVYVVTARNNDVIITKRVVIIR